MSIDTEANDLLMSSGAPSVKFPTIGTMVKGTVMSAKRTQQTDLDNNPKTFDNGDPMWQVVITLQTDERDAEIADDTGERRLYAKGQMLTAVREALKKAGAGQLDVGGTLAVVYEADGEKKNAGYNAPKLYRAQYQAPTLAADDLI